jgi:hypothetical protein
MNVNYILDTISSSWISSNVLLQKGHVRRFLHIWAPKEMHCQSLDNGGPHLVQPLHLTIKTVSDTLYEKNPGDRQHPK